MTRNETRRRGAPAGGEHSITFEPAREAELREAIELLYFAYRAFTARPDRILEGRGLGRVHHRILYFVGRHPGLSVNDLLAILDVSKQALNSPLRQLLEMRLIDSSAAKHDRRVKQIKLTDEGKKLEAQLAHTQMKQLAAALDVAGPEAKRAWAAIMQNLSGRE